MLEHTYILYIHTHYTYILYILYIHTIYTVPGELEDFLPHTLAYTVTVFLMSV